MAQLHYGDQAPYDGILGNTYAVDLSERNTYELAREREIAPYYGILGNTEEQELKSQGAENLVYGAAAMKPAEVNPKHENEAHAAIKAHEDMKEDASKREHADANEKSPYTNFNCTDDYVQAGYGAEGFVPKLNEEVDKELREPTKRVEQEEERRPTYENPSAKQEGDGEMAPSGTKEGNVKGIAHGKDEYIGQENHEGHHYKKGVFEKIKGKLYL